MLVRPFAAGDLPSVIGIIEHLPEYFTDDVVDKVRKDVVVHEAWVIADDGGGIVGFTVVDRRSPAVAEILWMAVDPPRRGLGLGTQLLTHIMNRLLSGGVSLVEVKTLDARSAYEPYESTRAFYERRGFVQVDTVDPLPGWRPGNPCAFYVAALRHTH